MLHTSSSSINLANPTLGLSIVHLLRQLTTTFDLHLFDTLIATAIALSAVTLTCIAVLTPLGRPFPFGISGVSL